MAALALYACIPSLHAENTPRSAPEEMPPEAPSEHRPSETENLVPLGPPSPFLDGDPPAVNPRKNVDASQSEPLSKEERMERARAGHAALRRPEIADPQSARNREIRNELMKRRANRLAREEERRAHIRKGRLEKLQDPRMIPLKNEVEDLPKQATSPKAADRADEPAQKNE